ncbi:acyl-CoA dehydrogenase [Chelativorans sp. Marseille-P2723]|uniref:acyl-CoA dehydrogenase n=1 Tax=Chelativorans sp. Marseille-P2723 TaxID=2709133 RepID=UPI0015700361|nr:acyl-CoA dehydrogenase [Chelativorans sp. Marseille-P2723]
MDFRAFRREYVTAPVFKWASGIMPPISETEREAIDAGTVWWDGALFTGNPDWNELLSLPPARLSPEEQAFMGGPVRELCAMVDDWTLNFRDRDLAKSVWDFMRKERFFGMIIPKKYGGLGFSNYAHSEVVRTVSSASVVAGVTIMVPNSLGPGELLMHFGTDEQRDYWLPRLADGRDIPCFGLTSPHAGSDAAAMTDTGVVEYGTWNGKKTLGIRLNFHKRYITLGPVATVMGLAFKMLDPENHLGRGSDLGITVALLPTSTPGVSLGERHIPLFTYFQNGPLYGKDVFVPLDHIIGGEAQIGQGWKMLMTALAAGRSISLPSQSASSAAMAARVSGAYARIRTQFNAPIGLFEGVQEPLAEIAANAYLVDAARRLTLAALDQGHRPSVLGAIMKYHATERMRRSLNHAMDIHGGKGIIEGPRNYLAAGYRAVPIGITVEGANILTRNLMIFGQGAIRSHPFMLEELLALADEDRERGLAAFDETFWKHIGHALKNACRTFLRGWSGGLVGPSPRGTAMPRYWRKLSRHSAAFAMTADLALLTLGGSLKRKEMISARLGDILAELYLLGAVLKRFEDEGRQAEDRPIVDYLMQQGESRMATAFRGVFDNLPARWAAWLARLVAFPFGVPDPAPSDRLISPLAEVLMKPSAQRDRLTPGLYLGEGHDEHPVRDLEAAFRLVTEAAPAEKKMREARIRYLEEAARKGIISTEEHDLLTRATEAVETAIAVDAFPMEELSPTADQHGRKEPPIRSRGMRQAQPAK